jgi:hypothetical protein
MTHLSRWLWLGIVLSPSGALAQQFSDGPICDRLVALNHAGIYIAYPQSGADPTLMPIKGSMAYNPNARFFFVPGFGPRLTTSQDEGVWHIRTRTQSETPKGTDTALVFRAKMLTRCSPNEALGAFDQNTSFVTLRGYENYHAEHPSRNLSTALHENFHLKIQDRQARASDGCTWTDDRSAFPNFSRIYSFQAEADSHVAGELAPLGSATADQPSLFATKYDGLSSEFAYDVGNTGRPACFGFTIPLPTNGLSRRSNFWGGSSNLMTAQFAGQTWRPVSTEVAIKRLRGRTVLSVKNVTIVWSR